ncbi:hypothetical protein BDZ91DRAFT_270900 [Kalaharituber pfeilii]|nr:hypothetical protein BDZ91DRAFT_270900 [Kalaharituber pfeilii]
MLTSFSLYVPFLVNVYDMERYVCIGNCFKLLTLILIDLVAAQVFFYSFPIFYGLDGFTFYLVWAGGRRFAGVHFLLCLRSSFFNRFFFCVNMFRC